MRQIFLRLLIAFVLWMPATSTQAQTLEEFEIKLNFIERNDNFETMQYSAAKVNANDSAKEALATFVDQNRDSKGAVKEAVRQGYRIGVFFDNGATARASAINVMERCASTLGDLPATMSYDNPYFKVSVGYCLDKEEAMIILNRVQRYFPKAYIIRGEISIKNIIDSRNSEVEYQRLKVFRAQLAAEAKTEKETAAKAQ